MYTWIKKAVAGQPVAEPSPLLVHLAGEFAPRVAALWRAPHAAFLTTGADRRHLVCLALARGGDQTLSSSQANSLLELSLAKAIALLSLEAPVGLKRALAHMGECAWIAADYRLLWRMLGQETLAKPLRHAKLVTPDLVRALATVPESLAKAGVGDFGLTGPQAQLLAETYRIIQQRQGPDAAKAAGQRWSTAGSAKRLFEMVNEDVLPEPPAPPFPGTPRLKPLRTKAAIRDAANRYGNCLRGLVSRAVSGDTAFYEWTGVPGAVVEIWCDPLFGWRLSEAKLARNNAVPAATRDAIIAELKTMGVHVGQSSWQVQNALNAAHAPDYRPEDFVDDIAYFFE